MAERVTLVAEIRWLVSLADGPVGQTAGPAADALIFACLTQLRKWSPSRCYADGTLPAPGVYGVPEQWPHIQDLYRQAGFQHTGDTEVIFLARIADRPEAGRPPIDGLALQRMPGICGIRISAVLDQQPIGCIEVDLRDADRAAGSAWSGLGSVA